MEEDKQQWLSIAAVVLVIVGLGYFLYRQSRQTEEPQVDVGDIVAEERAQDLAEQLNFEVPESAERASLRDVAGGTNAGLATRVEENGKKEISVLAALPQPAGKEFYAAYLVGAGEGQELYLGKLEEKKGGWILEYSTGEDLGGYSRVKVTKEQVDDRNSETTLLEGDLSL